MRIKMDRFTWIVIAVVAVLVIVAAVTVATSDDSALDAAASQEVTGPAAPVFNAIVAVQKGEIALARAQFTEEALAAHKKQGYDPIANAATYYGNDAGARRVRIANVSEEVDVAYVTIVEDTFSGGGLFGRSTWSNQRVIRVERVDGEWKIDDPNLFY
jgi:hypothetical protein